ncbi:MAG: type II secretion system F family protein [Rubripirellula sp.]
MNQEAANSTSNAFPENELPKWLLRKLWSAMRRMALAARDPQYNLLSRFAHDMGMCVRSTGEIVRGLEICIKSVRGTRLGKCWSGAVDAVKRGVTLTEALRPGADYLPPFYLQVIKAGEQSGRLDDAFEFLETHCKLLAGPASALRNVWVFPVAIILLGSIIKVVLAVALVSFGDAIQLLVAETAAWIQFAIIVAVATLTPARYFLDQVRLSIPLLGALEREIAVHRFFRVLALLYSVGGQRVEDMIETAAGTVSNNAARLELLKVARAIKQKHTITEAFGGLTVLTEDEKLTIGGGETSGTLERAFDRISDDTGASMVAKLKLIQPFLVRIVMGAVMFSIALTLLGLLAG